ncbi:rhomboid family protein [Neobacillus cucumis]|uniref:Rhomboid family intramembrane serine protease n=1 Tax=Neobacillus cucumis TaxID=1740721 RepID=A0A2N5H8B1_9BACI|nr:rhomboid family intramembrane serine protease [Neobacillus cucumis]PLS01758.1 rhomboid family intramembrane serine protease [Neobacillus cucumis]
MNNREGYVFWRLAYSFISDHGYRVIQLFENQKELWLERLENKKAPIIRMLLHDLDWSNAMQRDIEFTASNGERVRKQIGKSELNVLNIYVSKFPPVDEYEFRLAKPFVSPHGDKTKVNSILLANDVLDSGLGRISEKLERDIHFTVLDDYTEQEVDELKKSALNLSIKRVKTEQEILFNGKPLFTYVFIAIQLAVFLWLEINGGSTNTSTLIKYGAKVNALIYQGEWWRLITPVFLHIGFLHLATNTLSLYFLGTTVERIFGRLRFPFIYLFAGFTGFIASFLFSTNLSAGASGAIFGCFGALLYFGVMYPKLFFRTMGMNLIVILGINLVFGFSASGIDNAGHLGGLAGGFLAAGITYFPKKKKLIWQMVFLIASIAVIWFSISYGFSSSAQSKDENNNLMIANNYVKQGKYDQAYKLLKDTEKNADNLTERTYFLLSFVEIKKNMLPDAKIHLQKAIQLDPEFDEAYFNLALINMEQNDLKQAKKNAEKAAKLDPQKEQYKDLVKEINQHLQSLGG